MDSGGRPSSKWLLAAACVTTATAVAGYMLGRRSRDASKWSASKSKGGSKEAAASQGPATQQYGMTHSQFQLNGVQVLRWIAQYRQNCHELPVRSEVEPGYLFKLLPTSAPEKGESFEAIMQDLDKCIVPGLTHWESKKFFAYFKPHSSYAACLAELLAAGINVMGFSWTAGPACTELETITLDWLGKLLGLPDCFLASSSARGGGVIQGSAGESAIVALIAARERALHGLKGAERDAKASKLIVYVSDQTHSILEKACKVLGIDTEQRLRRVPALKCHQFALQPTNLRAAVEKDVEGGMHPLLCCVTMGTTSSTAMDPIESLATVCKEFGMWVHCDAAYGGAFCVCPEYRHHMQGLELCDSLTVNAHKALLTPFDLSTMYLRDSSWLVRALSLDPNHEVYLTNAATQSGKVIDYKDWQMPLGRRFRALKLWFVLRSYGAEGLRAHIRQKAALGARFEGYVEEDPDFELVTARTLSLVCFRLKGTNERNKRLMDEVNATGEIFFVHTMLQDQLTLRLACGGLDQTEECVDEAWALIRNHATRLMQESPE